MGSSFGPGRWRSVLGGQPPTRGLRLADQKFGLHRNRVAQAFGVDQKEPAVANRALDLGRFERDVERRAHVGVGEHQTVVSKRFGLGDRRVLALGVRPLAGPVVSTRMGFCTDKYIGMTKWSPGRSTSWYFTWSR